MSRASLRERISSRFAAMPSGFFHLRLSPQPSLGNAHRTISGSRRSQSTGRPLNRRAVCPALLQLSHDNLQPPSAAFLMDRHV